MRDLMTTLSGWDGMGGVCEGLIKVLRIFRFRTFSFNILKSHLLKLNLILYIYKNGAECRPEMPVNVVLRMSRIFLISFSSPKVWNKSFWRKKSLMN